ncbi:MAG: membrane protein insertase YidC [Gemmatimonadales bacterium]
MDRRFFLAIALMVAVVILPSLFIKRPPPTPGPATSGQVVEPPAPSAVVGPAGSPAVVEDSAASPVAAPPATARADTITVSSSLYRYQFSTRGGQLVGATLTNYKSMRPDEPGQAAQILPSETELLAAAVLVGRDTIRISKWSLSPSARSLEVTGPSSLTFRGGEGQVGVELTYRFLPGEYRIAVSGRVTGLGPNGGTLLVGMGPGLRNTEADSVEHARELGIVTKASRSELTHFSKLDVGEPQALTGPFEWVAVKSKYFAAALLALDSTRAGHGGIGGTYVVATDQVHRSPEAATIWTSLPVQASGDFGYELYLGPMEYPRLQAIGHDFDDINPYGWAWLRPIIRPVAVGARWLLVWFHERLGLAYGLGLILFGILIRVVLWPLNQRAMRAGMQMQAIQPILKELQEKHKNEPQKLQQEMFKVYKEHNVNPFSGCWPLLLPWPILIALFFVFQNSIELRGASFLWLPDLARPDPLFITPIAMGVSMFAVTKVGQIGLPPNPQMKVMLYVMPLMMIVLFFKFASGLNLYYATVNIASIPQQWFVAKERLKTGGTPATRGPPQRKAKR